MNKPIPHGTSNGYNNYRCRCDECKRAGAEYRREKSHLSLCPTCGARTQNRYRGEAALCLECRHERQRENLVHGNETGYKRGCRCEECRAAGARARRERRHRNPEADKRYNREYRRRQRARQSA